MARPSLTGGMSISQLETMLRNRRAKLTQLMRERKAAQQRLDKIDRQISSIDGKAFSGGGAGGGRMRNATSLVATMESVLRGSSKPMKVGDIVEAVLKTGYRTTSANFRGIVNQTLIKEKQFSSAGRGLYQMKKST